LQNVLRRHQHQQLQGQQQQQQQPQQQQQQVQPATSLAVTPALTAARATPWVQQTKTPCRPVQQQGPNLLLLLLLLLLLVVVVVVVEVVIAQLPAWTVACMQKHRWEHSCCA
jgi:hypothetical protein